MLESNTFSGDNYSLVNESVKQNQVLRDHVTQVVEQFFSNLGGESPCNVYKMVLFEVEAALFTTVLRHVRGDQVRAASLLGSL